MPSSAVRAVLLLAGAAALPAQEPAGDPLAPLLERGFDAMWSRALAAGETKTKRQRPWLLERATAREWRRLLDRLEKAYPEDAERLARSLQGVLLAGGPEGGLLASAERERFEFHLPPAAREFCSPEQGGVAALRAFLWRAEAERAWIEEQGGENWDGRQEAARRLWSDPGIQAELDRRFLDLLEDPGGAPPPGFAARRKRGVKEDQRPVAEQGLAVLYGSAVLVGRSAEEFARLRRLLLLVRQDEEARPIFDGHAAILFEVPGETSTRPLPFFTRATVGILEAVPPGLSPVRPDGSPILELKEDEAGRAIGVPGGPGFSEIHQAANVVSMAFWWKGIRARRNRLPAAQIAEEAERRRLAFLDRNPPPGG